MKKLLLIAVSVLLVGCSDRQKTENSIYRMYDNENGVICYSFSGMSTRISCVKVK